MLSVKINDIGEEAFICRKTMFLDFSLFSRSVAASNLKWFSRWDIGMKVSYVSMKAKSENIVQRMMVTSPKTLGTRLNSSMGKSAGKWASTRPPLLPIKSYAAVESELMKEIEKLQHDRPCPSSWPFAHRITFPLIDFFFRPPSSPLSRSYLYSFSLRPDALSLFDGRNKKRKESSGERLRATSTPRNNLRSVGHQINNVVRLSLSMNFLLPFFFVFFCS